MKIEFLNTKKYQSVDLIPGIHIGYKDKGLSIYFVWWWWAICLELKQTKHDVMGNLRR